MTEHTPGPWAIETDHDDPFGSTLIYSPQENTPVALVYEDEDCPADGTEHKANAALIATSPDLLDDLERFIHMAECNAVPGPNTIAQAKAHIAKARGKE